MKNQLPEPQTKEQIETKTVQERFQILLVDDDATYTWGWDAEHWTIALPMGNRWCSTAEYQKRRASCTFMTPDIVFTDYCWKNIG